MPENSLKAEDFPSTPILDAKYILSSDELIFNFMNFMRGYSYEPDEYGRFVWKKREDAERIVPEPFLRELVGIIVTHTGKTAHLSDLSDEKINDICKNVYTIIAEKLFLEHEKYNIKKENFSLILNTAIDCIYLSLRRAKQKGEKEFLQNIMQHRVIQTMRETTKSEEKKGFLDRIFKK